MSTAHPSYRYFFLARAYGFLMMLFTLWRVFFFYINSASPSSGDVGSLFAALLYGLRLDLAVTAYSLAPLFVLALFKDIPFSSEKNVRRYLYAVSVIVTLVLFSNTVIYHHWRALLNYRALTYLKDPAEVMSSVSLFQGSVLLIVFISVMVLTLWCCRIWLSSPTGKKSGSTSSRWVFLAAWLVITVTSVRGGWQQLPVNETHVFFSKEPFLNHTAVNPVWHLAYDVKMAGVTRSNPFLRLDETELKRQLESLDASNEGALVLLDTVRPNIVFILLESFTADVVEAMHGDSSLTPTLDSLIRSGVLFDQIYSTGFRTDQGVVSVLNGWPATPYHSVMRSNEKCQRLPSLVDVLNGSGYTSSFYYGGAANFSNMGAYLRLQGFDRVITQDSFSTGIKGRWGYHDEVVLARQLDDLDHQTQPFFSVLLTLSNHEPFDVPGPVHVQGSDDASRFRNAVHYTDGALRRYFEKASQKAWFENTLFVLVADHAHTLPRKRDILFPQGRHIPLVMTGPVLKHGLSGTRVHKLGGHHDLPVTLLHQLRLDAEGFRWSKDLCSPTVPSFAYMPIEDLLVWKTEAGWFLYEYQRDSITERSFLYDGKDEKASLQKAKAFMQGHYQDYLDL